MGGHSNNSRSELAFAAAPAGSNRDVGDRKPGPEKGHGAGGGVGKAVGQQVEKLAEVPGAHRAKARGQILDAVAGHPGGCPPRSWPAE